MIHLLLVREDMLFKAVKTVDLEKKWHALRPIKFVKWPTVNCIQGGLGQLCGSYTDRCIIASITSFCLLCQLFWILNTQFISCKLSLKIKRPFFYEQQRINAMSFFCGNQFLFSLHSKRSQTKQSWLKTRIFRWLLLTVLFVYRGEALRSS